jgi:lysophospholipase L1-like esterase
LRARLCGSDQVCKDKITIRGGHGGCLAVACNKVPSVATIWPSVLATLPRPSTVIVEIGVNDLFMSLSDEQFKQAYRSLVDQGTKAGVWVLLGTIPPTTSSWKWHKMHLRQQEAVNKWLRQTYPDRVIDFDQALKCDGQACPAYYNGGDGLHPNALGHRAMALKVKAGQIR